MSRTTPGVRLLPNAITVLALCSGLSAVQFALTGDYILSIGAIGVAAILDSLDGRIARLLDASSKMGAELDSLSDAMSFGVAPALVLYVWLPGDDRFGWVVALIFAVCMVLRLARFNTLLDEDQPPFASEFFVGVPAPAGGLTALLPVIITLEFGTGWWSSQPVVWAWTIATAVLLISRIPTLSLKKLRAPAKAVAPLLVGVGLLAAAVIQYPLIALGAGLVLYLAHIPYAVRRYRWLAAHPEAWDVPGRERRAMRRGLRGQRRLGLRKPRLRQVAGAARRAVQRSDDTGTGVPASHVSRVYPPADPARTSSRKRGWRRIGLRQRGR